MPYTPEQVFAGIARLANKRATVGLFDTVGLVHWTGDLCPALHQLYAEALRDLERMETAEGGTWRRGVGAPVELDVRIRELGGNPARLLPALRGLEDLAVFGEVARARLREPLPCADGLLFFYDDTGADAIAPDDRLCVEYLARLMLLHSYVEWRSIMER